MIHRALVSSEETFHYLGPGIEAEVVLVSGGQTTLSFFGQVSFLWNLGSSSVDVSEPDGDGAFYYNNAEDFSVRPGGGLRLTWRGVL